jgi:hypothetical protein
MKTLSTSSRGAGEATSGETLDAILGEVAAFRGDAPLLDDISLIGFEIL